MSRGFAPGVNGNPYPIMRNRKDRDEEMATLAVLAAAAREAEEMLADVEEVSPEATDEANRRLQLFMRVARQLAR